MRRTPSLSAAGPGCRMSADLISCSSLQSDRLFNAIKGHGGTVRLVKLPYESHGYAARESIMHMLWEMDNWLETYVKNREKMAAETIDLEKK